MFSGTVTELSRVGKQRDPRASSSKTPPFDRVEFQAPPDWVQQLDAAAEALGMGRSAYIRMACNRQMDADRRAREGK